MRDCERTKKYFLKFYTPFYWKYAEGPRDFFFKKNT